MTIQTSLRGILPGNQAQNGTHGVIDFTGEEVGAEGELLLLLLLEGLEEGEWVGE